MLASASDKYGGIYTSTEQMALPAFASAGEQGSELDPPCRVLL